MIEDRIAYRALSSRDPRFDGVFFVGVSSTRIYCRPICPARTPLQKNCRFFGSAAAAEKARYRPCLRCRPELAPGTSPVDQSQRTALLLIHRMEEGLLDDGAGLETIAEQFGLSSRQLRRIVLKELGVSPIELMQTRRLLLAKQLLTETRLPVTAIAFASGFSSLRRFNAAFSAQYRMPPSRFRKKTGAHEELHAGGTSVLQLQYRAPYDWQSILDFLSLRKISGVECVTADSYARTVQLGRHRGWVRVTHAPDKRALRVEFAHALTPVLPALLGRLRSLFDLSARPDLIAAHLKREPRLRTAIRKSPGLRVPGAFDGFELALRAIVGQQITVKAATTLTGRLAEKFGTPIATPFPELTRLTPSAAQLAKAGIGALAELGLISARAATLIHVARAFESGELTLEAGANPDDVIAQLTALPGIGPWTAHYISMRALRWPDAFPKEDIAVRNSLGGISAKEADELSQSWRPWRSYAVIHLWRAGRELKSKN